MMRPWALAAAAALAIGTVPAQATAADPSPAAVAKARELVALISPPDQRRAANQAMLDALVGNMMSGMAQADPRLRAALSRPELRAVYARFMERQRSLVLADLERSEPELIEATARAYARRFDLAELEAMQGFFATPAGQKYARLAGSMFSDPDIAEWQRNLAATTQARKDAELRRFLEELAPTLAAPQGSTHGS